VFARRQPTLLTGTTRVHARIASEFARLESQQ
jgi:hypothetical protein